MDNALIKRHMFFHIIAISRLSILIILFLFITSDSAIGALLGQFNFSYGIGMKKSVTAVDIDTYFLGNNNTTLFDNVSFTEADNGIEYLVTSSFGSNPDLNFNNYVALLTDGTDQEIAINFDEVGLNVSFFESGGFDKTPDFNGKIIESIGLKINTIIFSIPGSNPNNDGNWTDFDIDLSLNVHGNPVHIPSSFFLFGTALIGLAGLRKKYRKA